MGKASGRSDNTAPMTAKPAISLSRAKGGQPVSRLARTLDSGKKGHPRNEGVLVMRKEGLAHRKKISGSLSLAGRDGDVSVQAVAGGENQSA